MTSFFGQVSRYDFAYCYSWCRRS